MFDFVKSELLRGFSGIAMLGVASFAILIPGLMLTVGPPLDGLRQVDDGLATRMVFGLIASIGIVAMYLGSYAVSREYYYNSMSRSLTIGSLRRVVVSKFLASALTSVALCVLGLVIWTLVTIAVLASFDRHMQFDGAFWAIVFGSILVAAVGSVIGVSLGWIVKGYYVASGIVLLFPLMIELPLLFNVPEVERFLPLGAFAGVTGAPIDALLPWWGSGIVLLGWGVIAAVLAVVVARRGEH